MSTNYKQGLLHRVKIVRGHFEKVLDMIKNDDYCLDITQQTYAIQNALKKIDEVILEHHLRTCVQNAIRDNRNIEEKVEEVIEVFKRK